MPSSLVSDVLDRELAEMTNSASLLERRGSNEAYLVAPTGFEPALPP